MWKEATATLYTFRYDKVRYTHLVQWSQVKLIMDKVWLLQRNRAMGSKLCSVYRRDWQSMLLNVSSQTFSASAHYEPNMEDDASRGKSVLQYGAHIWTLIYSIKLYFGKIRLT